MIVKSTSTDLDISLSVNPALTNFSTSVEMQLKMLIIIQPE